MLIPLARNNFVTDIPMLEEHTMTNPFLNCETIFRENGPYYHVFSTPPEKELLCAHEEDYREMNNLLALSITESRCRDLAHAIMSNHLHTIISGDRESCSNFLEALQRRIRMFLRRIGMSLPPIQFHVVEITTLKQLRDEIAYVIRNPYAARSDINPFAYRWCSGYVCFNDLLERMQPGVSATTLPIRSRRNLKHERDPEMNPSLRIFKGEILPSSFVDAKLVMSLFENTRQFIWCLTRNVEAHLATAERLCEKIQLTDEEVYMIALKKCKKDFDSDSPRLLPQQQKIELIRMLKFDYGASNKQLSRCTGIAVSLIEELFPA